MTEIADLTTRELGYLDNINTETEKMKLGDKFQEVIDAVNDAQGEKGDPGDPGEPGAPGAAGAQGDPGPAGGIVITEDTPVNAVEASAILDITGAAIHGETVVIGGDIYEFNAREDQEPTEVGRIPVNIFADTVVVQAVGSLTVDVNPSVGDTMTIGEKEYIFVPLGTASGDGQIDRAATLSNTQENIVDAIKGTDDHNTPHPLVDCDVEFTMDVLAIVALVGGSAGNSIVTTETFAEATNEFGAATLETGDDCTNEEAAAALITAITTFDTEDVGAALGDPVKVELTALTAGVAGNTISISETMGNASFQGAATELSGGVDGTVGDARTAVMDSDYLYITIAENTIVDKNWRRIDLGSAY